MAQRVKTAVARREAAALLAAVLGALCAFGCSSYDRSLLAAQPQASSSTNRATPADAGGQTNTRVASGNAGASGGARDSGVGAAGSDAGGVTPVGDAGSVATDAAAPSDAAPAAADAGDCASMPGGDCCPDDPNKTSPGTCGCGTPDTDGDGDGTPDCDDACPSDKGKAAPGTCGCGFPDVDEGCLGLRAALLHRYGFDGTGTIATDSKGGANGTVVNTTLDGSGNLALAGTTSDQYVDLPNNLLSPLTNATLEMWLTWSGGNSWQRIFDFGSSSKAEGMQGNGVTYLFLTPKGGSSSPTNMRVTFSSNGFGNEQIAASSADLASTGVSHVVAVVDDQNNALLLYRDGVQVGSTTFSGHLSQLSDVNCWLGRSLYVNDPELGATLHEFRIYGAALSPAQVKTSFDAGPDATFF